MEASADLKSWATKRKLAPEIIGVLEENGFTSVEDLAALTPEDVKEAFKDSGLLNLAQYMALKRAVASLSNTQNQTHHHPPASLGSSIPPPYSAPSGSPMPHAQNGPQPPTYPSQSHDYHPQPYPHPPQSQPYLQYPQPYPSHSHPHPSQPQHHPPQSLPYSPQQPQTYPHQSQPYPNGPGIYPSLSAEAPSPGAQPQPGIPSGGQPWTSAGQSPWASSLPGAQAMATRPLHSMEDPGEVTECFRFLLLGKTGSGKSTTGNTIFGENLFSTAATFASVTSDCERKTNTRGGRKIEILDSPGLYDTHKTQEEIGVVIVQAVAGMHPGPHAILYVVRLGRYTQEEHGAYQRLKALFDESISRYLIVVFTYGDMLEREQRSIENLIGPNTPQSLQQVLRECHNRYIVFNNMASDPRPQVEKLLAMVRGMMAENGGQPYSCPKYADIGHGMEAEVARRLQEVEKRDLQRQKYVQELEKQTKEAEDLVRQTQEQFQKNEEERQRREQDEEAKRRRLEEELQTTIKEHQIGFEKYQQELQRLHQEREQQEQMMRERESEMSEMERKRAEEQAEKMRQQERDMQALVEKQQERIQRQKEEEEARRQEMERERQEFMKQMEERRRADREEMQKREEDMQKLWEQQREVERQRVKRHEEEMEKLKGQVVEQQKMEFITTLTSAVRDVIGFFVEMGRQEVERAEAEKAQAGRRRPGGYNDDHVL